jgi:hypothetical protein
MSQCIILFRNGSNQRLDFVSFDERGELAVFNDREAAEKAARDVPICRHWPYQIIEVDEI